MKNHIDGNFPHNPGLHIYLPYVPTLGEKRIRDHSSALRGI
jgi:hypothetical protein